ncbi:VCBS repeat-containing protein [Flavitalea sp. BT771]|uniref:VCBS repeat-containing protein n=1 Tax=Flavitalea sp. BT771 TaxID=3063329 RepID=UPI0026E16A87|nr:VCBS repeat-containing protein [Flavitalea sp. BT771]MDO6432826.1 VCBS repeat-containing protein [Flavitalea sp. BT771]MDV6221898.1 VCBS repeat-containing protein [Flavitalea sp. BT771]
MGDGSKIIWVLLGWVLLGCRNKEAIADKLHFTKMDAGQTHIGFSNTITDSDSMNVFIDEYMYNGAGVGVGDFNQDGLPDLFFCGTMVSSRLYINKGNFRFEDVTVAAGLQTERGCTGVSVADVNNDGYPDIYICASHSKDKERRKNMLFINDGKLHFTDQAEAYGLADTGYSTQAAFFDYDKDGDLDMYLLNHEIYSHSANNLRPKDTSGHAVAQDRLYRNDGVPAGMSHPVFHDVSMSAGIKEDGYGLGLVVTDVNGDGWPDVYVANDYIANDLLWLNNRDGTFTNVIGTALRHQPYNSMGSDAADINNDGLPDLAVVDMLPETNERKKMMASATNQSKFDMQQRFGYQPSYVRNMLQLNNGNRGPGAGSRQAGGGQEPFFSEIGQLAGVFQTDWSWSVLMADLDNDGWKDLHITNGLGKDITNNDYTTFASAEGGYTGNYGFAEGDGSDRRTGKKNIAAMRKSLDAYGSVKMASYIFHNNGDLTFSDLSKQAGIDVPAISNGAVYADLDNDGDLDLVTNNINAEASVWRNDLRASAGDSTHNFLCVELKGLSFGSKVTLYDKEGRQFLEESPVRGFCSSVDHRLYFGIGGLRVVDSLVVQWPDLRVQVLRQVKADQWLTVRQEDGIRPGGRMDTADALFTDAGDPYGLDFKHAESSYYDFGEHQPISQKFSQLGPCIATGDVNGDGLEDVFVGGAANQPGKIFIQLAGGNFSAADLVTGIKSGEDLGAVFFDADGDKDLDLLITGGSAEFMVLKYNQPRLYINDGKGHFTWDEGALPVINDMTKALAVADIDGDGDLDVFIGGRLAPQRYPQTPRSYILRNDHGKFRDVTKEVCGALEYAGMITDAAFADVDGDGVTDLVVCGEWMGVRFFRNTGGKLAEGNPLYANHGLWRCIRPVDLDKDGDLDFVVGNVGLNNRYGPSAERPMKLFAKDMDKNGMDELIPAYYIKDARGGYQLFPALDRNQLAQEIPAVKKKYLLHKDFSMVTMAQLKGDFGAGGWTELTCETAASVWIENLGGGKFKAHVLPVQAQFSPVNCMVAEDVDGDGAMDLVLAGNEYQAESNSGRSDASYGLVLKGNGRGGFAPVSFTRSGLVLDGDVRDMKMIGVKNKGKVLLAAPNDSKLKTFTLRKTT